MNAEESRKIMNDFNFGGLYECYDEEKGIYHKFEENVSNAKLNVLKNFTESDLIIMEKYNELREKLGEYSLEAGIISNGNHGLDLLDIYGKIMKTKIDFTNWKETPVMFVYDSPADHLKDEKFIYGKEVENPYKTEELRKHKRNNKDIDSKFYLSTHLWRERDINRFKEEYKGKVLPYAFFDQKAYGEFIVSLMLNFQLKNVYVTNLFRYQITSDTKNYYSLGQMRDIIKKDKGKDKEDFVEKVFREVFLKEVEKFKPEVIIATGNVYNYLEENEIIKSNKIKLIRTIHPAFRIKNDDRMCLNMCKLAKDLCTARVIEKEKLDEVISTWIKTKTLEEGMKAGNVRDSK